MSEVKQKQSVMRTFISSFVILILSALLIAAVQSRVITGKVTDDQGSPLAGVNVTIKNMNRGTITDFNGEYRITVQSSDRTLVYSFAGMKSKEVSIREKSVINVILVSEVVTLNEIVVLEEYEAPNIIGPVRSEKRSGTYASYDMSAGSYQSSTGVPFNRYNQNFNTEGYAA